MAFDRRWTGVNVLPVTLLLFIFSITLVGLCAVENSSRLDIMALITLGFAVIAVIHTVIDIYLYFTSKLKPLYVLVLACLLMAGWLGNFITEVIIVAYGGMEGICNSDYRYGNSYSYDDFEYMVACKIPKGRVALSLCVLILYIAAITLSAIAQKRERRARFEKRVNNQIAVCRSTNPPAMACPNCGTQMVATQQYISIPAAPGALSLAGCDMAAAPDYYVERDHKVLFGAAESKDEKYP